MTGTPSSHRFRLRLDDGSELPVPTTEALARRVARGDVLPHTALFDAGTGKWTLAGESPVVRFVVEEICRDRPEPLAGWSPDAVGSPPVPDLPGPPVGRASLDFGLTIEDLPDELSSGAEPQARSGPDPESPGERVQPSIAPRSPGGLLELDPTPSSVAQTAPEPTPVPGPTRVPEGRTVQEAKSNLGPEAARGDGVDRRAETGRPPIGSRKTVPGPGRLPSAATKRRLRVPTLDQIRRPGFVPALLVAAGLLAGAHTLGDRGRVAEPPAVPEPPAIFAFEPSFAMDGVAAIGLPIETESQAPLEATLPPAGPALPDLQLDPGFGVAPTILPDSPMDELALPPPPVQGPMVVPDQPVFTAFEVAPEVRNPNQVRQALQREYPHLLRSAGIGGTVDMWFHIDSEGVVEEYVVNRSSGYPELDEAALRVAGVFEFTPALHLGERVAVWVSLQITFEGR